MELQIMEEKSPVGSHELNIERVIDGGSLDFDAWTLLISDVEKTYPDDAEKIILVYDSFLSAFPLSYGYWRRYADHMARLCTIEKAVKVFELAVQSATYSVGVWVNYCSFSMSVFEDPSDVRRLFKRGLSFVGKDYLCHALWDMYIEFEFSQQHWSSLAHIYIQTLRVPTKKLHHYYDSFKKLTALWEIERESQRNSASKAQLEPVLNSEVTPCCKDDEILSVIKDLLDPSIGLSRSTTLQKYMSIGEQLYQEACQLDAKIHGFETHIRRPYFHVRPLDASQLDNWHHYLDFVEMQGDFDWAVKLYERCLITCANYPEFWMRYVEFMETKGGRELANFALDRATKVFVKSVPVIHLFNAMYKEQVGDEFGARTAFSECDAGSDSIFVERVMKQANMEKRLGNFVAASNIYEEALEMAAKKQDLHTLPIIYVQFSQLKFVITGSADAARDILIEGINRLPRCKLLLEELIKFVMYHGGSRQISIVDPIIANSISPGHDESQDFSSKDVEDISNLYLQFVDLCGSIHDVRKAWNRHRKLFPHSLRTILAHRQPVAGMKFLEKTIEESQDNSNPMTCHLSGSNSSDNLSGLPVQGQELSVRENHHIQSDQAITDQLLLETTDDNMRESLEHECHTHVEQPMDDAPNASTGGQLDKVANDTESAEAFGECAKSHDMERGHICRREQDPKLLPSENISLNALGNEVADLIPTASRECGAPQETMSTGSMLDGARDTDKTPSVASSMGSQSADSTQMLNGGMLEPGQYENRSPSSPSPMGSQAADSAQNIDGSVLKSRPETNRMPTISSAQDPASDSETANVLIEPVRTLSLASNENLISSGAHSHLQMPPISGQYQLRMNNLGTPYTDSSSASPEQSQVKQHQEQQVSPQQYPQTESGCQYEMSGPLPRENSQDQQGSRAQSQDEDVATQGNLTAAHAWPVQMLHQQGFASVFQSQMPVQSAVYTQPQMSQYPGQSDDQSVHMQSSQAYDQMWQYYYYQQQQQEFLTQQQYYHQQQQFQLQHLQQQQYQQQQLQVQQQYLQQQQLQQLQQPYPQQHQYLQHQQQHMQFQQQPQQQFPQQHLQQQQLPHQMEQMQQEQYPFYTQQLQNQQYWQSQQQQQPQLPSAQLLEQLLQQQQWKQQQQQQQQHQQEHQQQQQEHQQQAIPSQIHTGNDSSSEQGPRLTQPYVTSASDEVVSPPSTSKQSPQNP